MKKNLLLIIVLINLNASGQLVDIPIGTSSNQFTDAFGQYTNLWYDSTLNSIVFAHLSNTQNGWPSAGFAVYDYSTDGGMTWNTDQRFAYADSLDTIPARLPQAVIYNPPGNTDPNAAFVTAFGATNPHAGRNYFNGTAPMITGANTDTIYPHALLGSVILSPEGGMIVKNTGQTYWSAQGFDGSDYSDTIHLSRGTFNSATGSFDYSFIKIPAPVCTDASGRKMFAAQSVVFNDAGDQGFLVILGNDWVCAALPSDSTLGVIIYSTHDSGLTWNREISLLMSPLDPLLLANGSDYSTGFTFDMGIDKNNTLHVALPVHKSLPGGIVSVVPGEWGLFDIIFNGYADACLLSKPQTYRGFYGITGSTTDPEIIEDNRIQFSRSWDGSKVFFTWFDTDTSLFGSVGNIFPDMISRGYDLSQNLWTNEINFTLNAGLFSSSNCSFANVSYYTLYDGTNENIPAVYNSMGSNTGSPVQFHYIGGAAVSGYTVPGNCFQLFNHISAPAANFSELSASSPYPNPFTGKTSVDVTLAKAGDASIEISNTVGQLLSATDYKNLPAGKNTLTIDGSSLSKGLYFFTVKAGSDALTRSMSIE
jgi:hypothetical protein